MINILKKLKTREWTFVGLSLIFIIAQVWLDLKLPDYMKEITMLIQTPTSVMKDVWIAGGWMLLCALGSAGSAVIVGFFASKISATLSQRLRGALFEKVESFSMEEINKFSTASLITRSTNDITQIQMFVAMGMQALIKAPILAVWAVAKILNKSWQWSLATGVVVLIMVAMIAILMVFVMPKFKKIQTYTDNLNMVTRENLTGLRVVRAYNAESFQENKFEEVNDKLTKTNLYTSRMLGLMMPTMTVLMSGLSLAIYWIGAVLLQNAGAEDKINLFGDMAAFSAYAAQVVMAFMLLSMIFIMLPRASVSAKRINEVLNTHSKIQDGGVKEGYVGKDGEIEFNNVSFKYPDASESVIRNVNLKIQKGETVAFIGSTGSGKSTLINLVPRFYDATEGEVLVSGVNVKDYNLNALHDKIGYVPQKAVLFSGTVSSNVAYGHKEGQVLDESDVKSAVAMAQSTDFVEKMGEQYNSHIAQGGTNVSGGQKQRLSIARAIARKPEIYIFDDSFSALDYKTDRALRSALKKETKNTTTLIVAQRIGTIKDADKIVVIDDGNVVGIGKHKELLSNCEVYKEIAYSQLSKEELDNE